MTPTTQKHTPFANLKFEPHGGYGMVIDGEAFPFGYVSEQGVGKPVFELTPIFKHDTERLLTLALQMSAAPDMLAALEEVSIYGGQIEPRPERQTAFEQTILRVRAAIAKATGATQ